MKEVDPNEQLEEDVEDLMLQLSDEFVDELVKAACVFAKHRKSNIVEVKDVQLYLGKYIYHILSSNNALVMYWPSYFADIT